MMKQSLKLLACMLTGLLESRAKQAYGTYEIKKSH